jgi:L-iditol 2-dehydrogenase
MEEYIAIKKWNLVPIPQDLSFTLAALTEPTAVSIHAANKIGKCRTVGVFGSGTIGTVVGLVLKERGYDVTILGRNESSLEYLKDFGIETVHLSKAQQYDATIETANAATFVNCLKHTKPGGTVVCMGNPMTGVPLAQDDYWIIMRRELKIIGTWNSSFNDETNDWIEAISFLNRVKPQRLVTHEFELKDAVKAFETARDRKDITLKVIVNVSL